MFWLITSRNDVFVNLAAASTWLSQVMHSALLLPSKILMFFIICLALSLLLLLATWVMICVSPSTKSTGTVGDALLYVFVDSGAGSWLIIV